MAADAPWKHVNFASTERSRDFNALGVKDTHRLERVLEAIQDGSCVCADVVQGKHATGSGEWVVREKVRVDALIEDAECEGVGFRVICDVSNQFFRAALRKYECRVVDDKGEIVLWHDLHTELPVDVWSRGLHLSRAPPTKSAAKTG